MPIDLETRVGRGEFSFNHGEAHHPTRPARRSRYRAGSIIKAASGFARRAGPMSIDGKRDLPAPAGGRISRAGPRQLHHERRDAEISAASGFGKSSRFTLAVNNVLNRPTRHYAGSISKSTPSTQAE